MVKDAEQHDAFVMGLYGSLGLPQVALLVAATAREWPAAFRASQEIPVGSLV